MSSKALSKKTFEIENEAWLLRSMCLIIGTAAIRVFLTTTEFCVTGGKSNDGPLLVYFVLSWYFMAGELTFLLSSCNPSKHYRKNFIANLIYSFFITFFFYNPYVFEYLRLMKITANDYKYSLIFHFSSAPVVLANSYFITYVLWRMSKVKPDYDGDEPYLVIYGGGGSSTKQIDLDSE